MNKTDLKQDDAGRIREELDNLMRRFDKAKAVRNNWAGHWQEAYEYALPQRSNFGSVSAKGARRHDNLYDGTALDSVEQLAASLLAVRSEA